MFLLQQGVCVNGLAVLTMRPYSLLTLASAVAGLGACVMLLRAARMASGEQRLRVEYLKKSLVIMPLDRWSTITKKGLTLAVQLRGQVQVVHVSADETREQFESLWQRNVVTPLLEAEKAVPELVLLPSPGGQVLQPIADYILQAERREPDRQIIVVVPQLAVKHWWQKPLHNHRSHLLKMMLSLFGGQRITVVDVPWHL